MNSKELEDMIWNLGWIRDSWGDVLTKLAPDDLGSHLYCTGGACEWTGALHIIPGHEEAVMKLIEESGSA